MSEGLGMRAAASADGLSPSGGWLTPALRYFQAVRSESLLVIQHGDYR